MKDLKQELLDFLSGKIQQEEFWAQRETWGAAIGCHVRIGAFEEVKKFIEKFEADMIAAKAAEETAELEERKRLFKEHFDIEVTEEERAAIRKQWEI